MKYSLGHLIVVILLISAFFGGYKLCDHQWQEKWDAVKSQDSEYFMGLQQLESTIESAEHLTFANNSTFSYLLKRRDDDMKLMRYLMHHPETNQIEMLLKGMEDPEPIEINENTPVYDSIDDLPSPPPAPPAPRP